ncbi:MAG: VWA domain-containing protein [Dehalococcoidia bacterium]|nr:VWA domain-containing protein [Dehalococcoidia bacterium]
MNENSRGIEIVKQQGQGGVSITVGGESVSTQGKPLDVQLSKQQAYVYLLTDCSGSMSGYKLDQAKQGILNFATDALKNDYRVGLISFDTEARLICEPVGDIQILTPGVRAMRVGGSTNMVKAIKLAHDKLKGLVGTRVIVMATDGMPDNADATLKAARAAKDAGIDFIAIGTDDANQNFLGKLATRQDLAAKVSSDMFAQAIASASNLLPAPRGIIKRQ